MYIIQSITVYNNASTSKRTNVEKIIYTPSHVKKSRVIPEQCVVITQKGKFSALGILAEECIIHLVKGVSIWCVYAMENREIGVVQINGCNSTKALNECYDTV